jgi:hypothetical protein
LVADQFQQRLLKTGGRLVKHARYYWLLLAESHLTRRLFGGDGAEDRRLVGGDGVDAGDGCSEITGGQEAMVGEVFVECAEKAGFPGFGFFRQGDKCALRGRRRLPEEKL